MSTSPTGRGLIRNIFKNFWDSFKVIRGGSALSGSSGKWVGRDPFGNEYFEIPPDPSRGKRRAQRWYKTTTAQKAIVGEDTTVGFDTKMPAEWESWLRHRRDEPPTEEQVFQSLALADIKKRNAAILEQKRIAELKAAGNYHGPPKPQDWEKPSFPKYAEFEVAPGEFENRIAKDRWAEFQNPYTQEDTSQTEEQRKQKKE